MTKVTVMAGPCKFVTEITATKASRNDVSLTIDTQCPHFKALNEELNMVNAYNELGMGREAGIIKDTVAKYAKHITCPVAIGILKAVEVEAGLALPVNPEISIVKE